LQIIEYKFVVQHIETYNKSAKFGLKIANRLGKMSKTSGGIFLTHTVGLCPIIL